MGRLGCRGAIGLAAIVLVLSAGPALADSVSIGINTPDVSFGLNIGATPKLVPVQGLPVYHAPSVQHNYFFYSGHYYLFHEGGWYSAVHHNGPWAAVAVHRVPQPILAVPVTYYKVPPGHAKKGEHWKKDKHRDKHEKGKAKHKKWKDD
jgi:hypothetical protein